MNDTNAPNLTFLTFQSPLNVSSGAQPITFTAGATDDLSGVDHVNIWFARSLNFGSLTSSLTSNSPLIIVSDSQDSFSDGQSSKTTALTPYNSGTYTIDHVDVTDKTANTHTYNTAQLSALGIQTSLIIQGGSQDTTAPTLTSLGFQPAINVGNGTQPVTFTVGATDDLSGVDHVNIWFTSSLNFGSLTSSLTSNSPLIIVSDSQDSFSDGQSSKTTALTPFNSGTYTIDHVDVTDKTANTHTYNTAQLSALGIQTSLTIQGGSQDTTVPTLTSLGFQPTINVGNGTQPITFTVGATDDLSGVDHVNIWFTSSLNFGSLTSSLTSNSPLIIVSDSQDSFSDGQSSKTTALTPFNSGTYTIDHVDVIDKTANTHTYNTAQLSALGASTSFTVTNDVNHSPNITSDGGGDSASIAIPENSTPVTTVAAFDQDAGTTLTYSIVGGADQFLFHLDPSTHALAFVTAPNFEAPTDSDHNNSYAVQVQASDGALVDTQTIVVTVSDVLEPFKPATDFNADAHSDILWQRADGQPAIWLMNGLANAGGGFIGFNPGSSMHEIASGDFNGDGKADILWQGTDGTPAMWLMNGTNIIGQGVIGTNPGPNVHAITTGDFNGDGNADILWQASDGTAAMWLMNGMNIIGQGVVGFNPGANMHAIATGDFNGDGKADILWQGTDGTPAMWLMNGMNIVSQGLIGFNPGPSMHAITTGDFDGDGKADILWQATNGTPAMWLMNGMNIASQGLIGFNPGPSMHAVATGDFNNDHHSDILWHGDDGTSAIWEMNGMSIANQGVLGFNPGADWHIVA